MSDQSSLINDVEGCASRLIATLQAQVAETDGETAKRGFFPNGINHLSLKVSVGDVSVTLEASTANESRTVVGDCLKTGEVEAAAIFPVYVYPAAAIFPVNTHPKPPSCASH